MPQSQAAWECPVPKPAWTSLPFENSLRNVGFVEFTARFQSLMGNRSSNNICYQVLCKPGTRKSPFSMSCILDLSLCREHEEPPENPTRVKSLNDSNLMIILKGLGSKLG